VKWVDVRPHSSAIEPTWGSDGTIELRISKPCKLSIELNGRITMPLYIFANPPETDKPLKTDKNVIFLDGGKVHNIDLLNITSNQMVYIEGGAVVRGAVRAVHARNIKIRGRGIMDGTSNISHDRCFIRTKDDCIAIKANFEYPPEEIVENIKVTDCVFWNALWGNALEIGFELRAQEVKNIEFSNCDVIHVEAGAVISIHNADQSVVHDVLFNNIRIEDARHKLFDMVILLSQYSVDGPGTDVERKYHS